MKLAGPDLILFVIGFVLFAGAGYGLYATSGGDGSEGSASGLFRVDYDTTLVTVGEETVADLGGTRALEFEVAELDVTQVLVDVACTGQAASLPYTLMVKVEGPGGRVGEASGTCDGVSIAVPVSEVPASHTVEGDTADEAHENLGEHANATAAVGTWTVTVSGSRGANGVPVPGPGPGGVVTLGVEKWTHRFTAVPPS